jgi:hypothetical protein
VCGRSDQDVITVAKHSYYYAHRPTSTMALHTTRALQPSAQLFCSAGAAVVVSARRIRTSAPCVKHLAQGRTIVDRQ